MTLHACLPAKPIVKRTFEVMLLLSHGMATESDMVLDCLSHTIEKFGGVPDNVGFPGRGSDLVGSSLTLESCFQLCLMAAELTGAGDQP